MRTAAVVLLAVTLAASAAGRAASARVVFVHGGQLVVLDLTTQTQHVVASDVPLGPVAWSSDGKLLSVAGRVVAGPTLPTDRIAWAPDGETAAFLTNAGAVRLWSPRRGLQTILPPAWGARSLAWGPQGELALGRKQETPGHPSMHQEVWVWQSGRLRLVAGPIRRDTTPLVEGFAPGGRVLWWSDDFDSASIAADGLTLYANRTPLGTTLVFPDVVSICGSHLVFSSGGDRYATHGKSIVFDGRNISRDSTRSWVSPSCEGDTVVAAAGRSWEEARIGRGELRSIWQLRPQRRRLTHPPAGWTDEDPKVLGDGSILFVRTRQTVSHVADGFAVTEHARLELLRGTALVPLASLTTTVSDANAIWEQNDYGHYGWPQLLAVSNRS